MKMLFDESGRLVATEYFDSQSYRDGRPCCAVREGIWHLLLPERSPLLPYVRKVYAMPFTSKEEPKGWVWRLMIPKAWSLKMPHECFVPPSPDLPGFGEEYEARLIVYGFLLPGLETHAPSGLGMTEGLEILFRASLRVVRVSASEKLARGGKLPATYH